MVKTLQLKLVLLLCMIMGAGTAWADNYESVLTFDCASASKNGSSDAYGCAGTAVMGKAPVQAFLEAAAGISDKLTVSYVDGSLYWTKGSGGTGIPSDCFKVGKASGGGAFTFVLDDSYDDIDRVVITGYGWKTTSSISVNSLTSQSPSAQATETTFTFDLTTATKTINVTVTTSAVCITKIQLYKKTSSGTTPTTYTVTFNAGAGTFVGNTDFPNTSNEKEAGTYELPSATPASGYTFDGWLLTGSTTPITGNYTVSGDVDFTASYSQTGGGTTGSEQWVLTNLADLTSSDVFVIVGNNGSNYAMTNDNGTGSAPAASAVTVVNDAITSTVAANIQWNISGDATNGYTFYPNGSTTTWLYCTNANNGLRVGDSNNNTFVINNNYLYNSGQTRYIGIYNSSDWRSYTSINNNIKDQTFAFYKKVAGNVTSPSISANNVNITYDATGGSIGYTLTNEVTGGVLTASTTASWLTLGTVGTSSVPFTCSANDGEERTATVTLTYTYNTNETVTKTVTVTQAGNPNGPGTENNPYTVAQARAAIDAQTTVSNAYVTGIISQVDSYSDTYKSITYWISDDGTTTNQLEVYSGKGLNGADFSSVDDVVVGATVTVKGNLKKYNTTYEFDKNNELVSYTAPTNPYITADDVDIAYDATGGNIAFTVNNPSTGGSVSASTQDTWITLGNETASPITFTCAANTGAERTATVTLTYAYGNSQTVTKDVTVTQAANPNVLDNISDITAAGTYTVQGTIVAKSTRGFIVGDGTGYVYYYNQNYTQADYNIGDMVKLSGSVVAYGGVFEFNSSTTVTAATASNYVAEDPTVLSGTDMDSRVASTTPAQLSSYVQYEGTLSVSGTHYNITSISGATTAQGSISYPINTDFTTLNGKTVKVKGYYVGISSSTYYNTMIGSIEEVVSTTPSITPSTTTVNATAAETEDNITVTYNNINVSTVDVKFFSDAAGTTEINGFNWMDAEITGTNNDLHYMIDENTSTEARTAYLRIHAFDANDDDVYSDVITITQAGYVADYATLPFYYDGNGTMAGQEAGLTASGVGAYSSSPAIKFSNKNSDDYLILKMNEAPAYLTFDVKCNPSNNVWEGTFKVQTSADGVTYTDLAVYSDQSNALSTDVETKTFNNFDSNVRYIKWIYTKTTGNVALGKIRVNCEVVTIKADRQYTGFSCDKALDFEGTGLTAQIVTSATGASRAVTKVPANTGVIVGLDAVTTDAQTIIVPVCAGATENVDDNWLVAVLTATTIPQTENGKTNYVFGKGTINNVSKEQFFKVRTGGMDVPANNVYLAVPTNAAKDLDVIGFGGDATSINALEAETVNGNIYNLQGQKVNRAQKGIYIVNGRKVVIK